MFRCDMSPLELEELLAKLLQDYFSRINELEKALREEAELKIQYTEAYEKKYLEAKSSKDKKPTDKEAEAIAFLASASLQYSYELAKIKRRVLEEIIEHIRFELDILRSIYSFRKTELERSI